MYNETKKDIERMKRTFCKIFLTRLLLWALPSTSIFAAPGDEFGIPNWYTFRDQTFNPDTLNYGYFYTPIVIDTPEKLAQLSWLVNEEHHTFKGCIFSLGADIDLNKTVGGERVRWVPIGYNDQYTFDGMFLGMEKSFNKPVWQEEYSHSISGMYINANISTLQTGIRPIGLFGCVKGYLGYLRLTDSEVNVTSNGNPTYGMLLESPVGLLCGECRESEDGYSDATLFEEMSTDHFHAPHGIYNVSVDGSISISKDLFYHVGGIVGSVNDNKGVCHSTANISITYNNVQWRLHVGGITGSVLGKDAEPSIYDCAAHLTLSGDGSMLNHAGGVVGYMQKNSSVVGCSTSGSIDAYTNSSNGGIGGICGIIEENTHVKACVSTMYVKGQYNVGGIVGILRDHTAVNTGDPYLEGCMFAGDINLTNGRNAGGICGRLEDKDNTTSPQNEGLYIDGCLMAGTMYTSLSSNIGTIAGSLPKPAENVGGCYYDKTLATGDVVGGSATHASIRGLTTDQMTTGNLADLSMLPSDETADYGFIRVYVHQRLLPTSVLPRRMAGLQGAGQLLQQQQQFTGLFPKLSLLALLGGR